MSPRAAICTEISIRPCMHVRTCFSCLPRPPGIRLSLALTFLLRCSSEELCCQDTCKLASRSLPSIVTLPCPGESAPVSAAASCYPLHMSRSGEECGGPAARVYANAMRKSQHPSMQEAGCSLVGSCALQGETVGQNSACLCLFSMSRLMLSGMAVLYDGNRNPRSCCPSTAGLRSLPVSRAKTPAWKIWD